jgi:hypothetical protein
MTNHVASFGLLAAAGAVGAGIWWLYRSGPDSLRAPPASRALPEAAPRRIPSRRERYLASLEAEIDDAPPLWGDGLGSALLDDEPLSVDDGPFDEPPLSEPPLSAAPMSEAPSSIDDAPLSEGPMTERRVTARPHLAPPPVQSPDDYEAVDADSLGPFFLARAIDSAD